MTTTQDRLMNVRELRERQAAIVAALEPHRSLAALEDEERTVLAALERTRARRAQCAAELESARGFVAQLEPQEQLLITAAESLEALDRAGIDLNINPTAAAYRCRQRVGEINQWRAEVKRLEAELDDLGPEA